MDFGCNTKFLGTLGQDLEYNILMWPYDEVQVDKSQNIMTTFVSLPQVNSLGCNMPRYYNCASCTHILKEESITYNQNR